MSDDVTMAGYRCDRCQWAQVAHEAAGYFLCRKDTPRIRKGGSSGVWPVVRGTDWCGAFSPKRHAPWTATVLPQQETR